MKNIEQLQMNPMSNRDKLRQLRPRSVRECWWLICAAATAARDIATGRPTVVEFSSREEAEKFRARLAMVGRNK